MIYNLQLFYICMILFFFRLHLLLRNFSLSLWVEFSSSRWESTHLTHRKLCCALILRKIIIGVKELCKSSLVLDFRAHLINPEDLRLKNMSMMTNERCSLHRLLEIVFTKRVLIELHF